MSLEPGGRSDKYGNQYENRYLAKLLLRLVKEQLISVTVEPLGPDSDSVEFKTEQRENVIKYYQCKASNATHTSWSVADLKKYDVFERAKKIVLNGKNTYYYFISPLPYHELDELCKRARTNASPDEFVKYQLTNAQIRGVFNDCAAAFGFDRNNPVDIEQYVFILAHCFFEQYNSGTEAEEDLNEQIGLFFSGKAAAVRVMLEQYANDTGSYGVKITANDIAAYLEKRNIHARNYGCDKRVLDRIKMLNHTHWDKYNAIYDHLLHRTAADKMIKGIQAGSSMILHGKAGSGKSGCLQEVIHYLERNHILYLALKLDKHIPVTSADAYGEQLGLPESPIHCLAALSAGKTCVLILDQLDALRWTSRHSGEALTVCKELIAQAEAVNKYYNGNISIIFASRTFDLENDKGLKDLFDPGDAEKHSAINWAKIENDFFTYEEVLQIIGPSYHGLSPRLRKLLLTPSSLYVWSKLQEVNRNNSIASVYELMNAWWEQLQRQCESANIALSEVISCKNKIVEGMENKGVFSMPVFVFSDFKKVIDLFVSNGLLYHNAVTKNISFTHQSFLDYFIISKTMSDIYSGNDLKNLIGGVDEQTPVVRYRVLSVLQNLIDADQRIFAEQSEKLLNSDSVRYYFKCTVFEIIGQCENPEAVIFKIIDRYKNQAEWSDYINQAVFCGHLPYVKHLIENREGWFSDDELYILGSVSRKTPDVVTAVLRPFALQEIDLDRKIFWALCHDANDDSDSMFQLRCQLLRKNPVLFENFLGFSGLVKSGSTRAIDLFAILLDNWEIQKRVSFFVKGKEELSRYAGKHFRVLIDKLFPQICHITSDYLPQWPYNGMDSQFRDWTAHDHNVPVVRTIVEIVKLAFEALAQSDPEGLLACVGGVIYPLSAVGHELIMNAMGSLPVEYSDEVIQWLLSGFSSKIFVFTADETDYLYCTRQILQKFSPCCKMELFCCLEKVICAWKESAEKMVRTYKYRLETNHTHQQEPVYYTYWGHFQKTLLPSLAYSRLSDYSKALIGVLDRNKWIFLPHFGSGFRRGSAKFCVSPINGYTERLSDKTWLQIISTPQEKIKHHGGREAGARYIVANHSSFAASLGRQAKKQPERFAKLSLSFPTGCYGGYISNVLYALANRELDRQISVELMSEVIRRFRHISDINIAMGIAHVVEAYADEIWPDDILELISKMALDHQYSDKRGNSVTHSSDPECMTAHSLSENALNCTEGCALNAIASLLSKQKNLGRYYKETVSMASRDKYDAVRFAVMPCALSYYSIDKEFSLEIFKTVVSLDLRVFYATGCWEILSWEYIDLRDFIRGKLIEACLSEIEDLAEYASGLLCAAAVFYHDCFAFEFLMSHEFSVKQQEQICSQAVYSYHIDEYHERSEKILLNLIDVAADELFGLKQLFYDKSIAIQRDADFLIHLMESRQGIQLMHSFLEYLYESDEDICEYAFVIAAAGNSLFYAAVKQKFRLELEDLVKCVVRLFDRGKDQYPIRKICLDIWDKLFQSNLQAIKPLSDMIDNFE